MHSRQYFIERFRGQDTEELLDRLATADLVEEAKYAIQTVLKERGISDREFAPLVLKAKKDRYRRTSPTKECDLCGRSVGFSAVKDEGQKFCSESCLRTARLMEIAVDIPEPEILKRASEIQNGPCPVCRSRESKNEVRKFYWVWSAVVFTRWGTSSKVCCKKCGVKSNLTSVLSSLLFGWWGVPWGIFITPAQIISNIAAMFRKFDKSKPSEELVQAARLQLAEAISGQQAGGLNNGKGY